MMIGTRDLALICRHTSVPETSIAESKALSVISINIYFNNQLVSKNSKINCQIEFVDDYDREVTKIYDELSNYVVLNSNPGKVFIKNIRCASHSFPMIYGISRLKNIQDYGFLAHKNFVNYAGEITIRFNSSFFKFLDIFNFSSLFEDKNGVVSVDCEDKIIEALTFINNRFKNVLHLKITKSLMADSFYLKPNETPKPYSSLDLDADIKKNFTNSVNQNLPVQQPKLSKSTIINSETPSNDDQNLNYKKLTNQLEQPQNPNNSIMGSENMKENGPQHQYLAPYYSEFYFPIYNPYFSIISQQAPLPNPIIIMQDPVIEHPH
ncbi:MAG: hypothetical protein EBT63_05290 [Proteobacteria bacterium]|nr:hypothetical protein [Pseudomonadota bacterium]